MVRLDIGGWKTGSRTQEIDLDPSDLDLDPSDFEDLQVDVELERQGDRILVNYDVGGSAHLICDRTSEPFAQEVRGTHFLLFVPHDRVEAMGSEADDVLGYEPSDTALDISRAVRDTLLLSIPVRKVAPGAEDIEIQTQFGDSDEEDIDPRWEALRGLSDES